MKSRALPLLMVMLLVTAGCGGQRSIEADGYTIYIHGSSLLPRGGTDAEIEGTLATRDDCVVIEMEDAEIWYPVVWPSGTSIASVDPFAIRLPSGDELALGETVSGSGGYLQPGRVEVDVDERCLPETNEIAVFNPDDSATTG